MLGGAALWKSLEEMEGETTFERSSSSSTWNRSSMSFIFKPFGGTGFTALAWKCSEGSRKRVRPFDDWETILEKFPLRPEMCDSLVVLRDRLSGPSGRLRASIFCRHKSHSDLQLVDILVPTRKKRLQDSMKG